MGVPLFQEQAMRLAIEAAKFTPEEANGLRRAMATFRNYGDIGVYGSEIRPGHDRAAATIRRSPSAASEQIKGFGSYGFPESHAISFAKLVYVSAWIKCHHPDVFCAALLNSQPMGFYQPAQLVRDAREHGVEVREPDVLWSGWDSTVGEAFGARASSPHLKCGLEARAPDKRGVFVSAFARSPACVRRTSSRLIAAREAGARTLPDLARVADLSRSTLELPRRGRRLPLSGHGPQGRALWAVKGMAPERSGGGRRAAARADGAAGRGRGRACRKWRFRPTSRRTTAPPACRSKLIPASSSVPLLTKLGAVTAASLRERRDGARVAVGGLVLIRQRPGTAKGIVFITLEDETGSANAVVWKDVFAAHRREAMSAAFLVVHGRLQRAGEVIHVVAERFTDLSGRLGDLKRESSAPMSRLVKSRDFH